MSELELNPMFLRMRKGMGGVVFYEKNGQLFTRVKGKKTAPPSQAQLEINETFTRLTKYWSASGGILQQSWYSFAAKKKTNGYNLFMKENFKKERNGEVISLSRSYGEIEPPVFTAAPGATGEIIVSYTISPAETGRFLYLFSKKRKNGISDGDLVRHTVNREAASPYTITGLEPGTEYYIYGILTDWEYKTATQVSVSAGIIVASGS